MAAWNEYRLGEICSIQNGYSFRSNEFLAFAPNRLEVVKMGHIQPGGGLRKAPKKDYVEREPRLEKWILDKDDIVMAMTDMKDNVVILGVPALIDRDNHYVLNQRVARLKLLAREKIDLTFLYNQLKWRDFLLDLQSKANSGVQVNLTTDAIKAAVVTAPSLSEQQAIASVLSSLENKIDLLQRQNKTMEALAETLFREWFVEQSKEDWERKSLDEIAHYLNGLALQKYPSNGGEDLPVIKIKELNQGITNLTDRCARAIPEQYIVRDGDILFSWSGSLQLVIWHDGEGALNQHLFKVTSEYYPKWFYYLATKHHLEDFRAIAESKSTTMGHIQRHHLREAAIAIPPEEKFKDYNEAISPLLEKIIVNNSQIKTLTKQRNTLLPKLMSGAVRVTPKEWID